MSLRLLTDTIRDIWLRGGDDDGTAWVLPIFQMTSRVSGRLILVPFTPYGGACAEDAEGRISYGWVACCADRRPNNRVYNGWDPAVLVHR